VKKWRWRHYQYLQ